MYFAWSHLVLSHLYTSGCFDQFCKLLTYFICVYSASELLPLLSSPAPLNTGVNFLM